MAAYSQALPVTMSVGDDQIVLTVGLFGGEETMGNQETCAGLSCAHAQMTLLMRRRSGGQLPPCRLVRRGRRCSPPPQANPRL